MKVSPITTAQTKLYSVHDVINKQHIHVNNIHKGETTNKRKKRPMSL